MFDSIKNKLENWAQKDYFEPIFFSTSEIIDDLICYLLDDRRLKNISLVDASSVQVHPNVLVVTGFINHKNIHLLREKFSRLKGKKYIITAGLMCENKLGFDTYNQASMEEFEFVDAHIWGPNPSRRDIVNALLTLGQKNK